KRLGKSEEKALNIEYVNFETLLKESDIVSLHVPLLPETHHLIGENELKLMKSSSFLINTSRGPVVNESELVMALKNKMIKGAGLDVYENEPALTPGLIDLDNVVLLPHMGSGTVETRKKMAIMAAENLLSGLNGKTPPNCLNCDELSAR
ncbi:MAG: D-glycerate dehydrogenase, partial [Deltaproteobacteria bacterium]|nr:D-glycerate dehydrogenase [Deltaproteobacteria bacterium]